MEKRVCAARNVRSKSNSHHRGRHTVKSATEKCSYLHVVRLTQTDVEIRLLIGTKDDDFPEIKSDEKDVRRQNGHYQLALLFK